MVILFSRAIHHDVYSIGPGFCLVDFKKIYIIYFGVGIFVVLVFLVQKDFRDRRDWQLYT